MPPHVSCPADLVTSHEATRDGFLAQALTKRGKASAYVNEARQFLSRLDNIASVEGLVKVPALREQLLAASGFSTKAQAHLTNDELHQALTVALKTIADMAGDKWREEILFRFLLTRGDTLGGAMRNVTGALGAKQLIAVLTASLNQQGVQFHTSVSQEKVIALRWSNRLLVFDKSPPFIRKSVDAILSSSHAGFALGSHHDFKACGELKGGIDPAGADEHWKTARSALERIRERFTNANLPTPPLFFVGAAIQDAMADEIFRQLQTGDLAFAANLTVREQVVDLANWLTSL